VELARRTVLEDSFGWNYGWGVRGDVFRGELLLEDGFEVELRIGGLRYLLEYVVVVWATMLSGRVWGLDWIGRAGR
jgi:hypothetical protein